MPANVARRLPLAVLLCAVPACALSACAVSTVVSSSPPSPIPMISPPAASTPRDVCLSQFSDDQLLSWAGGTVADFRAYQYGGPTPTRPLSAAFAALADDTAGAWCGTRLGSESTRWWAVVGGQQPVKAIDIIGPGEGVKRGAADGPPRIP
jgi:hypothetical protein